jgi:hypothetical protein
VETPPVLDGVLDDSAWQEAALVEDFHIVVSNEFGTPAERSRVYVAFDADNLYFAARFWDSKPDTIVAKVLSKRDASFGEDGFSITLDPYDQARAGYMFDVNPNGMRSEAIYTTRIARTGIGRASGTPQRGSTGRAGPPKPRSR